MEQVKVFRHTWRNTGIRRPGLPEQAEQVIWLPIPVRFRGLISYTHEARLFGLYWPLHAPIEAVLRLCLGCTSVGPGNTHCVCVVGLLLPLCVDVLGIFQLSAFSPVPPWGGEVRTS